MVTNCSRTHRRIMLAVGYPGSVELDFYAHAQTRGSKFASSVVTLVFHGSLRDRLGVGPTTSRLPVPIHCLRSDAQACGSLNFRSIFSQQCQICVRGISLRKSTVSHRWRHRRMWGHGANRGFWAMVSAYNEV